MTAVETISVGARRSPLSQAQVKEILNHLRHFYPEVIFSPIFVDTAGDKDLSTSLRSLDKTDFFTQEVDRMLIDGQCRIGIHSAKDLPDPLPPGITVAALTEGIDPSDSLVFAANKTLVLLPQGAMIATSSERREEMVRMLRPDLKFVDIRGNIGQRLAKLEAGEVDGVVVAEAALIRLGLTHLKRVRLPGSAALYQGQLAVTARAEDLEMQALFSCIDSRKKVLYLGLNPPQSSLQEQVVHYPVIAIHPRPVHDLDIQEAFLEIPLYTHLIFTSKSAVAIFFEYLLSFGLNIDVLSGCYILAVGHATAKELANRGREPNGIAQEECAEGIVEELKRMDLSQAYIFWPHSSLSRLVLSDFFESNKVKYRACVFYDTCFQQPLPAPDLSKIDEIVFTSPSTVEGFLAIYAEIPKNKLLKCIGPVTQERLNNILNFHEV